MFTHIERAATFGMVCGFALSWLFRHVGYWALLLLPVYWFGLSWLETKLYAETSEHKEVV
jgi:uncharacterized membrane protein (Fun14 family)